MTKAEKEAYKNQRTIGYWSACGGIEIKDILHGISDYAIVEVGTFAGSRSMHKLLIHYGTSEKSRAYINFGGHRYYFDECIANM